MKEASVSFVFPVDIKKVQAIKTCAGLLLLLKTPGVVVVGFLFYFL